MHLRTCSVLLLVASMGIVLFAEEVPIQQAEIEWKVAPDGSLQCKAPSSWKVTGYKVEPPIPPAITLPEILWPSEPMERSVEALKPSKRVFWMEYLDGIQKVLPQFLHGGQDLASLSDPEWHYRKLHLSTRDEDLVARIEKATPPGLAKPLAERDLLDRLLAVRLCGVRKVAKAKPALATLAAAKECDVHLKEAASQSLDLIDGKEPKSGLAGSDAFLLAQIPAKFDLLVVFRPCMAPLWRRPWYGGQISNGEVEKFVRQELKENADVPNNLWFAQDMLAHIDISSEYPYEVTRAFGNARWDRGILVTQFQNVKQTGEGWLTPWPGVKMTALALAGIFPKEKLNEQLSSLKPTASGEFMVCRKDKDLPTFAYSDKNISYSMEPVLKPNPGMPKEQVVQLNELKALGIERQNALWIFIRDTREISLLNHLPHLASVKPAKHIILSLEANAEGMQLEATISCEKAEDARATVTGMEALLRDGAQALQVPPGNNKLKPIEDLSTALKQAKTLTKENDVVVQVHIPATPEAFLEACIEMGIEQRKAMRKGE